MIYRTLATVSLGVVLGFTSPSWSQLTVVPNTSNLVTTSQLTSAISAATPAPCSTPLPDTLLGDAGTQPVCMTRPDATRPTVIQAKDTTTAADASWTVTFDRPFTSTPVYTDARIYGSAQPYLCTVTTLSTTGASGKCFQLVATTLPVVATSLLGLVVSPLSTAGSGMSVRVIARQ